MGVEPFVQFGEHSCEISLFNGPVVQEEMLFEDVSFLALVAILFRERNPLCILCIMGNIQV